MSMWSLTWHSTNKSVTAAPYRIESYSLSHSWTPWWRVRWLKHAVPSWGRGGTAAAAMMAQNSERSQQFENVIKTARVCYGDKQRFTSVSEWKVLTSPFSRQTAESGTLGTSVRCQTTTLQCNIHRRSTLNVIMLRQLQYDTRCYFNMRSKADMSQLNLPHGINN